MAGKRKLMKKVLAVILLILTASLALSAATKQYELQLANPVDANGVQIKAGTYKVALEESSLLFYQGKKEVAKVPVRVEQLEEKNDRTSVSTSSDKLTEVRLTGTKMKLMVGGQ